MRVHISINTTVPEQLISSEPRFRVLIKCFASDQRFTFVRSFRASVFASTAPRCEPRSSSQSYAGALQLPAGDAATRAQSDGNKKDNPEMKTNSRQRTNQCYLTLFRPSSSPVQALYKHLLRGGVYHVTCGRGEILYSSSLDTRLISVSRYPDLELLSDVLRLYCLSHHERPAPYCSANRNLSEPARALARNSTGAFVGITRNDTPYQILRPQRFVSI